jgi:chromosome segregation ATPase
MMDIFVFLLLLVVGTGTVNYTIGWCIKRLRRFSGEDAAQQKRDAALGEIRQEVAKLLPTLEGLAETREGRNRLRDAEINHLYQDVSALSLAVANISHDATGIRERQKQIQKDIRQILEYLEAMAEEKPDIGGAAG